MWTCKHCNYIFEFSFTHQKANHSRWCFENKNRNTYKKNSMVSIRAMNEARIKSGNYNQFCKARNENKKIPDSPQKGKVGQFKGKKHTNETKIKMRQSALKSNHRRLVKSCRIYVRKDGTSVLLDSSWEEKLARRLDDLEIEWIRPDQPIKYTTNDGVEHNYFPDFYLPKYDLFLDPKNPAALEAQKEKINILAMKMKNLLVITSLEGCVEFDIINTPREISNKG